MRGACSALDTFAVAGVVHEEAAHGIGSDREEMGARLPLDAIELNELEIGLVDQRGRVERVPGALVPKPLAGNPP
jgi:hypothetical protein